MLALKRMRIYKGTINEYVLWFILPLLFRCESNEFSDYMAESRKRSLSATLIFSYSFSWAKYKPLQFGENLIVEWRSILKSSDNYYWLYVHTPDTPWSDAITILKEMKGNTFCMAWHNIEASINKNCIVQKVRMGNIDLDEKLKCIAFVDYHFCLILKYIRRYVP